MGLSRSELVTLKAKIKAEMQRRNGLGPSNRLWTPSRAYGSVSQFAGGEYDLFTHQQKMIRFIPSTEERQ